MASVVDSSTNNPFVDQSNVPATAIDPNTVLLAGINAKLAGTLDVGGSTLNGIDHAITGVSETLEWTNAELNSISS